MNDVTTLLKQFSSRYRAALLAKSGVLLLLGGGVIVVLTWRLHGVGAPWAVQVSLPATLAGIALAAGAWWIRRHWLSTRGAASYLDRALGLKERLMTAEEFSRAEQPPALYALLVDDVASSYRADQANFPRPLDRTAGVLALALLLLLLLPLGGAPPIQLAQLIRPQAPPPTPPPPDSHTPPEPPQRQQQQQDQHNQQNQSSPQQDGQGQQGAQQPRDSGRQPSQSGDSGQQQQAQAGGNTQQTQGAQGTGRQSQQQQSGASSPSQQQTAQGASDSASRGQEQHAGQQQSASGAQAPSASAGQSQPQPGQAAAGASQQASAGDQRAPSGSGTSAGNQEALKQDIQALLQEMSGELKDLEAQLASAKAEAHPQAGADTDSQLYGSEDAMPPSGSEPAPIQLKTDEAPSRTQRPGGGVGQPSGTVARDGPRVRDEDTALSDAPAEEGAVTRTVVPPEYRSVFDHLHQQQSQQPSEQTP